MAVTGLILIGFLLAHMYGNLKIFAGPCGIQRIRPPPADAWSADPAVQRCALDHPRCLDHQRGRAHVRGLSAVVTGAARRAAGSGGITATKSRTGVQRSYASFTLRWGGIVIVLFVIYHLLHLTWNIIHPGGPAPEPYGRVVNGFQIWSVVFAYTIAVIAVGLHVRHGTWSALTTLGANTSSLARRRLNALAYAVAGVLTVGFLLPPFAILFGFVS